MSNKSKKKSASALRLTEAEVRTIPTVYTFNFKDVPADQYAKTLDVLFHNPDFCEQVEKRNTLVKSAERLRQGSSEMFSLLRAIQQRDRKLADMMYAFIVQSNLHSEVSYDFLSFEMLLKYYVDYSKKGTAERVDRLAGHLDALTFLADMLESILVDVKADMQQLFGGEVEFNQFDAVQQVLTQLRGFFKSSRSQDCNSPDAKLYMDYSDSINDYLYKRLKTYTDKYRKLHPAPKHYTEAEMVDALNQFFGEAGKFNASFIKHTNTGGSYIDAVAMAFHLNPEQTAKIDKLLGKRKPDEGADAILKYCFTITDVVMETYKKKK